MCRVTRFYVQRQASGATVSDPETFRDEDAAIKRAAFIGRRTPAQVYRVFGDLTTDLWSTPQLIAAFDGPSTQQASVANVVPFRRAS